MATAQEHPSIQRLKGSLNYPESLPVVQRRDELVEAIASNQVLIVAGETGSGKSTQLPKLCVEAGRGNDGLIGHTQPRRLAARSVAERIAEETKTDVGDEIGFAVRFNDRVGDKSRIKVMTDGILLAELQRDRNLRKYDTIIIDEAHERSLNIDFLLGYLKNLLSRRGDLHLIVTSATIDTARFSAHFDDAPIIEVSGRSYPVELRYRPLDQPFPHTHPNARLADDGPLSQIDGICAAATELMREGPGDILVFLSGEREIRETGEALTALNLADTEVFPLFARLSSAEQHRVFRPHRGRRIVLATNVAETSVTVPGIHYVIDAGTARISRFNQRTKVQRLPIEPVSQASADQRAGRCGRVGPGICIRLYAEDDYDARPEFTEPEIQRTNLASVILQMASLGLGDIHRFPFVDAPDPRSIADGIRLLEELHALNPDHEFTRRWLTPTGRELAKLPVDPRFARMIVEAADHGGLNEVLIIVAGLSIQDPRERPTEAEAAAATAHARFNDDGSDFLTLLNLWEHLRRERKNRSANQFRRMCRSEFLNHARVREWFDTHRQLRQSVRDLGYRGGSNKAEADTIHRALLAGLLSHIGTRDDRKPKKKAAPSRGRDQNARRPRTEYHGARGSRFTLGRRSVLADKSPRWVMAAEMIETNRLWATMCAPINPGWAEAQADHLTTHTYTDPTWDPEAGTAFCAETVHLYGLPIVSGRRLTVARVNPELARELFIHHALVEGDWQTHHRFVDHNAELVADFEELQARSRRRDLLVEHHLLYRFFDQRIPDHVASGSDFNKWWKKASKANPDLLHLTIADLTEPDAEPIHLHDFPSTWPLDDATGGVGGELELAYEFDAASHLDGVSVHIPAAVLPQLDADQFTWGVPGQRAELVAALIRSLPKSIRREFTPVADTAATIAPTLSPTVDHPTIGQALAHRLGKQGGLVVRSTDFDWSRIPGHLRPTFRVLNPDRELLAEGKDLTEVQATLADQSRAAVAEMSATNRDLERSGLRSWDFDRLPAEVVTEADGHQVTAYPALVDEGDSVAIHYTADLNEQADTHWDGVRRLIRFALGSPIRRLDRALSQPAKLALLNPPVQTKAAWYNDTIDTVLDEIMIEAGPPPLDRTGFDRLVSQAEKRFDQTLAEAADRMEQIVERCELVRRRLDQLGDATFDISVGDAAAHFARLVPPGVMAATGMADLANLVRSLDALAHRLDKMPEDPRGDLTKAADCVAVEQRLRELVDLVGPHDGFDPVRRDIEEFRVLSFAQHLRRPEGPKVSRARIERALAAAARSAGVS